MSKKDSNLIAHAKREIELAGVGDADADYGGMIGKSVMELMEMFSQQGHSGQSAILTITMFAHLARYDVLTPLTDDPEEWMEITADMLTEQDRIEGKRLWQSRRKPSVFSRDGGKNWHDLESETKGKSEKKGHSNGNKQPGSTKQAEQSSPKISSGSKGGGKAEGGQEPAIQSATEPQDSPATSSPKNSGGMEGSKREVEESQFPNRSQSPSGKTESGTPSKTSGKEGGAKK